MIQSIDDFVDKFWPEPTVLADEDALISLLHAKYPLLAVDEFLDCMDKPSDAAGLRTFDLAFEYDMVDDVAPTLSIRGRETLKLLIDYLGNKNDFFTLCDAGFGDGRTALGLAAVLPQLQHLHGIDISPYAASRLIENAQKLPPPLRELALSRITTQQGDYFNSEDLEAAGAAVPAGVFDVSLVAYSFRETGLVLSSLRSITKRNGELIACVHAAIPRLAELNPEEALSYGADYLLSALRSQYRFHHLDFQEIRTKQYAEQELFLIASAFNS